jgi:glycoside hydrolase-like protein
MSLYPGQEPPGHGRASSFYWGVDSITPANAPTPDGRTFFKLIADQAGRTPQFWGRYIGSPRMTDNLTVLERDFLLRPPQNCRIALIYNGIIQLTPGPPPTYDNQTAAQGANHATLAIAAAVNLGAPVGVYIYLNAEPAPTRDFYQGWFDTFQSSGSSGYLAGVYGDGSLFYTEYCKAYVGTPGPPPIPPVQSMVHALLWAVRWSSCDTSSGFGLVSNLPHPILTPIRAPCNPSYVVQQYEGSSTGCPVLGGGAGQNIDMDLANTTGFKSMWAPAQLWELVWHDGNTPLVSNSKDGIMWGPVIRAVPVATIDSTADTVGTMVARNGKGFDLYASGVAFGGVYGRRLDQWSFDGAVWSGPTVVYSIASGSIRRPIAFRSPDWSKRGLAWVDSILQFQDNLAGANKSWTYSYGWSDVGPSGSCLGQAYEEWRPTVTPSTQQDTKIRGFNFQIPSLASIQGIEITANFVPNDTSATVSANSISITNCPPGNGTVASRSGGLVTLMKSVGGVDQLGIANGVQPVGPIVLGGPTYLWGLTWTPANFNNPNDFGIVLSSTPHVEVNFPNDAVAVTPSPPIAPPPNLASSVPTMSVSKIRVWYLSGGSVHYVDLDGQGNFIGSPILIADNQGVQDTIQGYFDANGNPVVAWDYLGTGQKSTRVGGAFGAPVAFNETDHDTFEAQMYQGFSASFKSDPSTIFYALKKTSAATTDPNYTFRTKGVPVDSTINLRSISVPPDPAKAVNFDDNGLGLFLNGSVIASILVTDDNTNFDVWMLRSPDAGTTWECRLVARNWNKSYVRSVDFYKLP